MHPLRIVGAGVLLEVLLGNSVEGKRGNRSLEARRGDSPGAVGTAPAAEVVGIDPDQVFIHTSTFTRALGLELGCDGRKITRAGPPNYQ